MPPISSILAPLLVLVLNPIIKAIKRKRRNKGNNKGEKTGIIELMELMPSKMALKLTHNKLR